jgi:glycosyltransferase involved in cell wall biosynthesis
MGVDTEIYYPQKDDEKTKQILEKYKINYDYLFFAGAITVRKNLINLIRAYKESDISADLKLILAGNVSYGGEQVVAEIEQSGMSDRVKLIGYVPEDDLPVLYSSARAFLFPTYYEGFGLPILEAMACGTPVLIGNRGAAPETAGGLALKVDPFDVRSIAFGIDKIITMPESNIVNAIKYASGFSWGNCARATIDLYKKVLG